MDVAYSCAFAALAGSAIGGLTSLAPSWLSQHVQFKVQRRAEELSRRQEPYNNSIEEASKWYADTLQQYRRPTPVVSLDRDPVLVVK